LLASEKQEMIAPKPRMLPDGVALLNGLFPDIQWRGTHIAMITTDGCSFSSELPSWCTKWGSRGLLFCEHDLIAPYDFDWAEQSRIVICSWESVDEIRCMRGDGDKTVALATQVDIVKHVAANAYPQVELPYVAGFVGEINLICSGTPRSERSAKGKLRTKKTVSLILPEIQERFPRILPCAFEAYIETFTSDKRNMPDLDRSVKPILDAFSGIVYKNDKQIESVHHRIFNTNDLLMRPELKSEPTSLAEILSIPIGSLAALLWGHMDYYVIRLSSLQ
jgi:hypothetical protein